MCEPCLSGPVMVVSPKFGVEEHFLLMEVEKLRAGKSLGLTIYFKGISVITSLPSIKPYFLWVLPSPESTGNKSFNTKNFQGLSKPKLW